MGPPVPQFVLLKIGLHVGDLHIGLIVIQLRHVHAVAVFDDREVILAKPEVLQYNDLKK